MKYREVAVGELLVCKINLQKLLLKCSSQDKPAALTSYEYLGVGLCLFYRKIYGNYSKKNRGVYLKLIDGMEQVHQVTTNSRQDIPDTPNVRCSCEIV